MTAACPLPVLVIPPCLTALQRVVPIASLLLMACGSEPPPAATPSPAPTPPAPWLSPAPRSAPPITPPSAASATTTPPPEALDALRAACVADIRSGRLIEDPDSACARFERATRASVASPARPTLAPTPAHRERPRPTAMRRPPPPLRETPARVDDCARWQHGSIAYRECRAEEKAWLVRECQTWSERAERPGVTGRELQQARSASRAWCKAARHYRIVQ